MDDKLSAKKPTTVVTTGKGESKAIVAGKPQVSSQSGKVKSSGRKVDVVFVIDTTGSMSDKIEALLATCRQFVDEAEKLDLDAQFALIAFGDISIPSGGDTIQLVVPMTDNIERIKHGLTHIPRNNGFGNEGETCLEAIQEAFKIQHREGAVKVLILITDEPAVQYRTNPEQIIQELTKREYLVFVVAIDKSYYKEMAAKNGGVWKQIGPDTDLSEILAIFREIARKVVEVATEVHLLGKGSVKEYLRLKPPQK